MSGRVLPFEGKGHREAEQLLPWFVNGTLDAEERLLMEHHLEQCPACRREAAELGDWRTRLMADASDVSEAQTASAATHSWQRLYGRLQALGRKPPARPWRRVFGDGWRQSASWLRWGVAAQSAALLLAGALLFAGPPDEPQPAAYRTLAATQPAPGANGNLVIVFDPRVTEAQLRRLLRASEARIVDGPNDAGAYVLDVPAPRLAMARAALRAAPGVTLVESLAPDEGEH